ncbi:hypothetical protein DMUE_4948 [Dictyocoela muelleri]|nr:hypothetical protein DMUE_4948 [Dictyocoela muelleri]
MKERNNLRNFRLCIVPNSHIPTLSKIMGKYKKENTIIASDGYPSYPKAVKKINFRHIVVTHVDGFVNNDEESTNKIENLWSHLKADIRKNHGVVYTNIKNFLKSFSFKKKYITNITNC